MATCIDCKLRGWSETIDGDGEVTRTGEVIDLCPLHAAAGEMLVGLREIAEAEVTRLREQVEMLVELSDEKQKSIVWLQSQLAAANAVVEGATDAMNSTCDDPEWDGLCHIRLDWIELVKRKIIAYRATQKGGE